MNNNTNNNKNNSGKGSNNNESENNEKKMAEVEKKSALPILAVGVLWILCVVLFRRQLNTTMIILITALSFVVYNVVSKMFPPKRVEINLEKEKPQPKAEEKAKKENLVKLTPEERALKDLNERIDLYFIEIKLLNDSIGDAFISSELRQIEHTLKKIQTQLNDNAYKSKEKKVEQLSQFFDYYMPTTIKILNSYRRIEKQNLTGENATETKKRVEESLPFIKKAFEKELDNMFSEEMLDITTDIDVIESMLSKDGLIEKNTIGSMKDIKSDIKDDFLN